MNAKPLSPRLSVLVLTRNRRDVLRNCIRSILRQRHRDFEIVIMDDASDGEDTAATIAHELADPRIRAYRTATSLGVAGGRNLLMEKARGEILVSIDDDAVFPADKALDEVCRAFERDPDVGIVAFRITNVINGNRTPLVPLPRAAVARTPKIVSERAFVPSFIGCGHAIRKRIIHDLGGYRQDMVFGGEEVDLAYRVIHAKHQIIYEPSIEVDHFPMPSVVDGARNGTSSELYYQVRNHAYLAYRYLPWKYAFPYLGVWMIRYVIRALREGSMLSFISGALATPRFLRGVNREVLDRRSIGYMGKHGGQLWYCLSVLFRATDAKVERDTTPV